MSDNTANRKVKVFSSDDLEQFVIDELNRILQKIDAAFLFHEQAKANTPYFKGFVFAEGLLIDEIIKWEEAFKIKEEHTS